MTERYRTVRLCANGGGFEALPEPPRPLDLRAVRRALEATGFSVVDARVMLIVAGPPETTIAASGRLLVKTRDEAVAAATLQRLRPALG